MSSHVASVATDGSALLKRKNNNSESFVDGGERSSATNGVRKAGGGVAPSREYGHQDCQFFFEDEVFRIDRKGRVHFGVITETAESYSSDEDEDMGDALGKGEVRVAFYPEGKEIVQTERSIGLADRTLMPGDVVRRCLPGQKDLSGQAGYVREVSMRADVKILNTKYVIKNVTSERLRQISEWTRDLPVCSGTWIGTTVSVDETAIIRSSNGARLEISSNDFHKFKDAYEPCTREVFSPNVYYPGNVIIGRLPPQERVKNLSPELPFPVNRKYRAIYTVESVKTSSITVNWTCRASCMCEKPSDTDPLKQPKSCIKGDDLQNVKRLNLYESCMLQIHDRFYLKFLKCDKLIKYQTWEDEQMLMYASVYQQQKRNDEPKSKTGATTETLATMPSSSRTAKSIMKLRRLSGKNSVSRAHRSQLDLELPNASLKGAQSANVSGKKSKSKIADDNWESVEDDEEDEEVQELLSMAPEPGEMACSTRRFYVNEDTTEAPTTTTASSAAVQLPRLSRYPKRRHGKKKMRNFKKALAAAFAKKESEPKDGDELVVETLVVYSTVTVVWQNGKVEANIPSTQLYPIHHLDNHEFFPGDFVSKSNECGPAQMDYGVVQCVDHDERIAKVKWFNIYGNMDQPIPSYKEMDELSVYDLKDHSDYQYRPGTMVIRVSNFTGDDLNSTAGQVIDNFPDGRVRVWWAKGHITMCFPQDLFELNRSEQEQDGYASDGSDDSWETQSENSRIGMNASTASLNKDPDTIAAFKSAKNALGIVGELLRSLQPDDIFNLTSDLLSIYALCRRIDDLLNTNLFHHVHFADVLVRRPLENLDIKPPTSADDAKLPEIAQVFATVPIQPVQPVNAVSKLQDTSTPCTPTPTKRKSSTDMSEVQCKKSNDVDKVEPDLPLDATMPDFPQNVISLSNIAAQVKHKECAELINLTISNIAKIVNIIHDSPIKNDDFLEMTNSQLKDSLQLGLPSQNTELAISRCNIENCDVFLWLLNEQLAKCYPIILANCLKISKDDVDLFENSEEMPNAAAVDASDNSPTVNDAKEPTEDAGAPLAPLNLNVLSESLPPLDSPMACSSPSSTSKLIMRPLTEHCFEVVPNAPTNHHFYALVTVPTNIMQYQRAMQREYRMLQTSLPEGVHVRVYENRMDLMSVMMVGPKRTPYENALFFFEFQMGREFPRSPPTCHYISYCTDRLNPNLYEEGKVCVSLLGTWAGRDTELWTPESTMMQVLVSIQGLILVDEPYYNEAGYEKQRGTQLGMENSRVYNEMAVIKIAHSTVKQLQNPPSIFRKEMLEHFTAFGDELHNRIQGWSEFSDAAQRLQIHTVNEMPEEYKTTLLRELPEFPLLPCSRGFCIALKGVLNSLRVELDLLTNTPTPSTTEAGPDVPNTGTPTAPRATPEEV